MSNAVQANSDQTDVLVVDDDAAIVDQLVECFRLSGISCASATDPIDALRMLHEGLNPAVVLTDLRMPDLDGLGLASRLVQLPHGHRPEIIFVSGHANLQDAIEAMQLGARDLLLKPVDREKLLTSIRADKSGPAPASRRRLQPSAVDSLQDDKIKVEVLEMLREMRRVRSKYLPEELFSDPCWDVLLDLYEARLSSTQVSVTALGATSGVPMSTALRRIGELQQHGLVERVGDSEDKRRSIVSLTRQGLQALDNFFDAYAGRSARH
jgi:CheY-like chemotaxis protein/predicted transcriptional regulator